MSRFLCNWNKRCPQCGGKVKYITTDEAGLQSDIDHYICLECKKNVLCQTWDDGRYSITMEYGDSAENRIVIYLKKAITPYILEQLEDKIAALLESEGEKGYIRDLTTLNITNFPLSDEHEYSEEIQELRNWKKFVSFPFPKYLEIKHPVFWAKNGEHFTVWFELASGEIGYFDYLPDNRPPFILGKFESKEIALKRAKEMVDNESWWIAENQMTIIKGINYGK